jgi:Pex14 N-terminal domain
VVIGRTHPYLDFNSHGKTRPTRTHSQCYLFSQRPQCEWYMVKKKFCNFKFTIQSHSSSLAHRVQFLEAKGLTPPEIEDALKQAGSNQATQLYRQTYQAYPPAYGPSPYSGVPPPSNQWDWRDYFVSSMILS